MSDLIAKQQSLGDEIERLVRNFAKDSSSRKTKEYLQQRQTQLSQLWREFKRNHELIEAAIESYKESEYLRNNYYNQIKKLAISLLEKLEELLATSSKGETTQRDQPEELLATSSKGEATLKQLPVKISSMVNTLQILMKALKQVMDRLNSRLTSPQPTQFLEMQRATVQKHWEAIQDKHFSILKSAVVPSDYDAEEYMKMEEEVEVLQMKMMEAGSSTLTSVSATTSPTVKLPRIQLPKFDGNYLRWQEFHDLFCQLIDQSNLGPAQKLFYLKANVEGEAEALIKHLTVCDKNYSPAWELIKERYQNRRLLVTSIIQKLISQPNISQETTNNLKGLHDVTQECIRGLQTLEVNVDQWDPILIFLLLKKLDSTTHVAFERSLSSPRELPSMKQFLQFLEFRFQAMEAIGVTPTKPRVSKMALTAADSGCKMCRGVHQLHQCSGFVNLNQADRKKLANKWQLCFNCLRAGHAVKVCTSRSCTKCGKRHHTLLHNDARSNDAIPKKSITESKSLAVKGEVDNSSYVLLATAEVFIINRYGEPIHARVLLDSGSQLHLMTERFCAKLGLKGKRDNHEIVGIGNTTQQSRHRVFLRLKSKLSSYEAPIEALVISEITTKHPTQSIDTSNWPIPKNISLADPHFNQPKNIDLLIGAELFCSLLCSEKITMGPTLPVLQNTVLGWVAIGKVDNNIDLAKNMFCGTLTSLDKQLERFWTIEEVEETKQRISEEDNQCEEFFESTVTRNHEGRFVVRLPFSRPPSSLGESRNLAELRLRSLLRKLDKNDELRSMYTNFINEYLALGHMEPDLDSSHLGAAHNTPQYYLPHHSVLRPDNTTTKLRVVFDGSAKTSTNLSLNDILHTGPALQNELFGILIRFRTFKYAMTADIQKMFRQILINREDQECQKILWRESPNGELKTYRLKTVTYGTRCAPYLATKCLLNLAETEGKRFPMAAQVTRRDFYVDDLLTGTDDLQQAINLQQQLIDMLQRGGFNLHKWCSNNTTLLKRIPAKNRATEYNVTDSDDNGIVKALGLIWHPASDQFNINTNVSDSTQPITKRVVLAQMSQLFDPLGLVNPVVVLAKIFMQQLWESKIDWDTPLSEKLQQSWKDYRAQLSILRRLAIPRYIMNYTKRKSAQLHGFADASRLAYGACIYMRTEDIYGNIDVALVCAKSRVAPTKQTTIARLELCGAKLLAQLMRKVKNSISTEIERVFYWSDSQIVLQWIASPSSKFTTFVGNRVAYIQTLTEPNIWQHIDSVNNPADILSRGMFPSELCSSKLWFEGPEFLKQQLPASNAIQTITTEELPELQKRKTVLIGSSGSQPQIIRRINHHNNFKRLQETTAFVLRFIRNCKLPKEKRRLSRRPSPLEMKDALKIIVAVIQVESFEEDLKHLQNKGAVQQNSKLRFLTPFIDPDGLIRVAGRIKNSDIPTNAQHPVLISPNHEFTPLIFNHLHQKYLHAGALALHYVSRETFWCINGRRMASKTVWQCMLCARLKPKTLTQLMGDLPVERVRRSRPFLHVGVDFCGPIQVHHKIRGKRPDKAYIALFVCFSTKAIHLELVCDLSSAAFIGCLKRFIARRGRPVKIFSDNATNFVGANTELQELALLFNQQFGQIEDSCADEGIEWLRIPPRSPHFGGLWEAGIKSAKYHLKRMVGCASLTHEELSTAICQIEAVLNSRPISQMSSDPTDLQALTPGHFLIGEPLTTIPDPKLDPGSMPLLTRWKLVRGLHESFWRRWSKEYLQDLQQRPKWQEIKPNVKPGLLVMLKEENLPPLKWRLGRIINVKKGSDGRVRVVEIKTATGMTSRAINMISPLPNIGEPSTTEDNITNDLRRKYISPVSTDLIDAVKSQSKKRVENVSNDSAPKRVRRFPIQTLLCLLLVLPVLVSGETKMTLADGIVELIPFKETPGIYFEEVNRIKLTDGSWKIITYYDLTTYWMEYDGIRRYIPRLIDICSQEDQLLHVGQYCKTLIAQFEYLLREIEHKNELLHPNQLRARRSPLNIIGSAAHLLFGVLDEEFATQYENDIGQIKQNEGYLLELIKNQTMVLDCTSNILAKETEQINQQFRFMKTQFEHFENTTFQIETLSNIFNSLALQTTILLSNFKSVQDVLLQVVTNTYHGKINPLIIKPSQLRRQLQIIRENLPKNQVLPVSSDFINKIYSIATVRTRTTMKRIIFDMRIPLTFVEEFQLLKLYAVPTILNNISACIKPSTEYLATNLKRDKFFPLSAQERSKCLQLSDIELICPQNQPIYTTNSHMYKCETALLAHRVNSSAYCNVQIGPMANTWIPLAASNNWIYVLIERTTFDAICQGSVRTLQLNGSGVLKLNPTCELNHPAIIITGHSQYLDGMNFSFYPMSNLSDYINQNMLQFANKMHLKDITIDKRLWGHIKEGIDNLKQAKLPETISPHNKHTLSATSAYS